MCWWGFSLSGGFMYNLSDYIPYTGQTISGTHKVLAWNKQTGYYFTEAGFCILDTKLIAMEDK